MRPFGDLPKPKYQIYQTPKPQLPRPKVAAALVCLRWSSQVQRYNTEIAEFHGNFQTLFGGQHRNSVVSALESSEKLLLWHG